jgi:hypothetical protein
MLTRFSYRKELVVLLGDWAPALLASYLSHTLLVRGVGLNCRDTGGYIHFGTGFAHGLMQFLRMGRSVTKPRGRE